MPRVLALAKRGASEDEIASYLHAVQRDRIPLETDEAQRADVARRVLRWYADSLDRWQDGAGSAL